MFSCKILLLVTSSLSLQLVSALPNSISTGSNVLSTSTKIPAPTSTTTLDPEDHTLTATPITVALNRTLPTPKLFNATDTKYFTDYKGPIRHKEWAYYRHQNSQTWWETNLDRVTGLVCLCSAPDLDLLVMEVASIVYWEYHSHFQNKTYTMYHTCGPEPGEGKHNACWEQATGISFQKGMPVEPTGFTCSGPMSDNDELCVNFDVKGNRWINWNDHSRHFDRKHTHKIVEKMDKVSPVCSRECEREFNMDIDVHKNHDPSFLTTWYPAKPIGWPLQEIID